MQEKIAKQIKVKSPCIGVCSTGIGGTVCRGCKRFMHEIVSWNAYQEHEKQAVLDRLNALLVQVVSARILVVDKVLLHEQITLQKVRYDESCDPHCWVFDLLKAGANQIPNLKDFGCEVRKEYAQFSLAQLRDAIDEDFFELSQAHHDRYFP